MTGTMFCGQMSPCLALTEERILDGEQRRGGFQEKGILNQHGHHSILQRHAIPSAANWNKLHRATRKRYLGSKQSAGVLSIMEWHGSGIIGIVSMCFCCHVWCDHMTSV